MSPEISLTQTPANVRHGSNIGQPLTRREGVLKVRGQARYAADNHPPGMLHAVMAVSSIARGRVTFLDVQAAKNHPGVVEVMTPANRPPLAEDPDAKTNPFMFRLDLLQNDKVRYANQPIAVVIAKTLEAATEGAARLAPRYDAQPARVGLDAGESFVPPAVGVGNPSEMHRGDVKAGLAAASKRIDAVYETPAQYHNAMEPHAIVVAWDGDSLSIDTPSQGLAMAQGRIAGLFGIAPNKIHIRSPYLGGGFGSKGLISGPQILGILAARLVGKPVKLVLRREQMYGPVGHRAPTRQTLRIGIDSDGLLTAIDHHARTASSTFDDFFEPAADASHTLYASPAISTSHEAVRIDTGTPLFMRAPGEATGSIALESAIDEAAWASGIDPLAFRLKNYADVEPISGKPFSSKALARMLRPGRRTLRLVETPARAATDARRCRAAGRLGRGHGDISGADVPGRSACGDPRRWIGPDGDRRSGYGPGRMDRARPDRRRWARTSRRWNSGRVPRICRTQALPAAQPIRRPRAWRSTMLARLSSPSSPILPPATIAHRCSAPAMPALPRAMAACSAATMKTAARATRISLAAPG